MNTFLFLVVDNLLEDAVEANLLMRKTTMSHHCSSRLRQESVTLHHAAVQALGEWRSIWAMVRP